MAHLKFMTIFILVQKIIFFLVIELERREKFIGKI